jgi:hypothetical protein
MLQHSCLLARQLCHHSCGCTCKWLQRGMFGYSGHDITSPREDKVVEDPVVIRCSAGNTAHERQRLYNFVCMWETVANVQSLGLWGFPADFSADTDVDFQPCKTLDGFPEFRTEVILGLRHLWVGQINAPRPLHDSLRDPRLHVCGQLHGPYLGLTRWIVSLMNTVWSDDDSAFQGPSRGEEGAFRADHRRRGAGWRIRRLSGLGRGGGGWGLNVAGPAPGTCRLPQTH